MPRAGLTPAAVVNLAGDLADTEGYEAVTLASLAAHLNVRAPSLYKHLTSLADLQRRLGLDGMRGLTDALRDAAVGRAGADALRAVANAYRRYARDHPGRYAASLRAPAVHDSDGAALAADLTALMADIVRGYHLDGEAVIHAVRTVRAALHGFTALEQANGFALPFDLDDSFDHLVNTLDYGLRQQEPA